MTGPITQEQLVAWAEKVQHEHHARLAIGAGAARKPGYVTVTHWIGRPPSVEFAYVSTKTSPRQFITLSPRYIERQQLQLKHWTEHRYRTVTVEEVLAA